jgi:hypothetical protein
MCDKRNSLTSSELHVIYVSSNNVRHPVVWCKYCGLVGCGRAYAGGYLPIFRRAASERRQTPRLSPRGHWDLQSCSLLIYISVHAVTAINLEFWLMIKWVNVLSYDDIFYLLIVGVEGYCCTWQFSVTHTHASTHAHSVGLPWMRDRPNAEASTWPHATFTRGKHPCLCAGIEPAILGSERPQTHAWDRAATGTGL